MHSRTPAKSYRHFGWQLFWMVKSSDFIPVKYKDDGGSNIEK